MADKAERLARKAAAIAELAALRSPPPVLEKRKPLTRAQFGQLMIDQEGRCGCGCGHKLQPMTEGVIDEHYNPLGLLGTNEYGNRRLYRKPCARKKTDTLDTPRITKAKRQARETGPQRPDAIKQPIKSRGFDKTLTKKFDGSVVRRPA